MWLSKYLVIWQAKESFGQNIYGYHGLGLKYFDHFVILTCWNKYKGFLPFYSYIFSYKKYKKPFVSTLNSLIFAYVKI